MPKKPNRKDMQNYIGKGNGDKSGEYTFDNGGGGSSVPKGTKPKEDDPIEKLNKDFPLVDIPDEDTSDGIEIIEKPKSEKPKDEKPLPAETKAKVKEYIKRNSTYNKADIANINRIVDMGDDDCNAMIGAAYEKGNYKFDKIRGTKKPSCFRPTENSIGFNNFALNGQSAYKADGETFYHENGHLIDCMNGYGNEFSLTYVSKEYGKTVNEMIKEEGKNFVDSKMFDKIREEEESYKRSQIPKISGLSQEEVDSYYNAIDKIKEIDKKRSNDVFDKREELQNKRRNGEISYEEEEKLFTQYVNEYHEKSTKEQAKYYAIKEKHMSKIQPAEMMSTCEMYKAYGPVEDIINGAYDGYAGTYTSHRPWYWQIEGNKGREFFAECFSATAIKGETGKIIQKYFPKSYNIVNEIIRSVQNG